jgi:hypothetical protein
VTRLSHLHKCTSLVMSTPRNILERSKVSYYDRMVLNSRCILTYSLSCWLSTSQNVSTIELTTWLWYGRLMTHLLVMRACFINKGCKYCCNDKDVSKQNCRGISVSCMQMHVQLLLVSLLSTWKDVSTAALLQLFESTRFAAWSSYVLNGAPSFQKYRSL